MPEKMRYFADEPGPPDCSTADHYGISPRTSAHRHRIGGRSAIAIRDDWNRDRLLDGGNRRPIRPSLVKLRAGTAVDGHRPDSSSLGATSEFRSILRSFVPAESHF